MFPTDIRSIARRARLAAVACVSALLLHTPPAAAQLSGENLLGDMGVKSGTQPDPGIYVSSIYYRYGTDSMRDAEGRPLNLDSSGAQQQTIHAAVPIVYWVTPKKLFGGTFAMMAVLPVARGALEAPGLGLSEEASTGLSDLYVMPAQLGWHFARGDVTTGVAFFAPTGRYSSGASDNLGKGMWSYEVSAGGTLYLDRKRAVSVSTTAFWEAHSDKSGQVRVEDVSVTDVKVGQLLTLEGGVARSFLHGAAHVGIAYYAQWKLTADQMELAHSAAGRAATLPKHQVWGIGPDITIPIATKARLISLLNVRYLWEHGAQVRTQGRTLMITNTIPLGGIKIPARR